MRSFFAAGLLAMTLSFGGPLRRGCARRETFVRAHLGTEFHLGRGGGGRRRMRSEVFLRGGEDLFRGLVADAGDLDQFLERRCDQLLHRLDAAADQLLPRRLAEAERLDLDAARTLLVVALLFVGLGHEVDLPAGEPRREPGVLAALADRERELVVGDDAEHAL